MPVTMPNRRVVWPKKSHRPPTPEEPINAPQIPYEPDESHAEALFRPPGGGAAPPAAPVYDPPCKIPALAVFEQTEQPDTETNDEPTVTSEWVVVEDPS